VLEDERLTIAGAICIKKIRLKVGSIALNMIDISSAGNSISLERLLAALEGIESDLDAQNLLVQGDPDIMQKEQCVDWFASRGLRSVNREVHGTNQEAGCFFYKSRQLVPDFVLVPEG
jgi:hypothetical protein